MTYISFFALFQTIIVWWAIWSAYHIAHTLAWFHAGPVMDCGWYLCYGWCSYCWCSCCLCCGGCSCYCVVVVVVVVSGLKHSSGSGSFGPKATLQFVANILE